jgi:hypothetical protein
MQKTLSSKFRIVEFETMPVQGLLGNVLSNMSKETSVTFITSSTTNYIMVYVYYAFEDTIELEEIVNSIMLNEGNTPLPYEPYTGGKPSPNPEFPQEIASVGDDGSVDVVVYGGSVDDVYSDEQLLSISTPNGIPGIKVTDASLATYTDADGQMWCADEVDFDRSKKVQRISSYVIDGTSPIYAMTNGNNGGTVISYDYEDTCPDIINTRQHKMFDKLLPSDRNPVSYADCKIGYWSFNSGTMKDWCLMINVGKFESEADAKAFLNENPITFQYILATPIETDLTAEEIEAYRALTSNYPTTTILNDENAHMEAVLVADTKNHIEQNYVPKSEFLSVVNRVSALEQQALA